jgi:hypothetical protein
MENIGKYYEDSRGPELGTVCAAFFACGNSRTDVSKFGGSLLAMTFRAQAAKWPDIAMIHVETVIVAVHRFIRTLLEETFGDKRMREELWTLVLLDKLKNRLPPSKGTSGVSARHRN